MKAEQQLKFLEHWLHQRVKESGCSGVVLGLSGGVDSAVAAAIAARALPGHCLGIIMPCYSEEQDIKDAHAVAATLGMKQQVVDLKAPFDAMSRLLANSMSTDGEQQRLLHANIKARLRMITLYYYAQARRCLVLGTSNKSEITVGYSTKYGDHGVDLQLLGDLTKAEVFALARYLELPSSVIDKAPSGGLWPGQTDEKEMGISYAALDHYLQTGTGERKIVERIQHMNRSSEHKRRMPPIAILPSNAH